MWEHKYKLGDIVTHKLTGDKLIVVLLLHYDPIRKYYHIRKMDYAVHEVIEEELETAQEGV